MNNNLHVLSVNVGNREKIDIGRKAAETGIFKQPVSGNIEITDAGLSGDVVANTEHHGGRDQAVYIYSAEDYEWFSEMLQRPLAPGTFGENLTFSSFGVSELRIGDRFQINDVLLEVTAGRIPCATLAARMDDPGFVKKFRQAKKPGVYTRVLNGGALKAGDAVKIIPDEDHHPTVNEILELVYSKERNTSMIESALKAPIAERARGLFQSWTTP